MNSSWATGFLQHYRHTIFLLYPFLFFFSFLSNNISTTWVDLVHQNSLYHIFCVLYLIFNSLSLPPSFLTDLIHTNITLILNYFRFLFVGDRVVLWRTHYLRGLCGKELSRIVYTGPELDFNVIIECMGARKSWKLVLNWLRRRNW